MAANSRQSKAVLAAVHELDHPTADEVFAHVRGQLPRVSLATVYRNLGRLVSDGDVALWQVDGHARYDHNTTPHLHLRDTATDRLIDLPLPTGLQAELAAVCSEHFDGPADCTLELKGTLKERP
ncbi:MAG: Fur family transcriptional regulator [Thermoplasmatota archaeon]